MTCRTGNCYAYEHSVNIKVLSGTFEQYHGILTQMKAFKYSDISYMKESFEYYNTICELLKL